MASRPPSRKSGQEPPFSLLRGSTTPCQYLLRIARSSGARRASDPTNEPASVCARRVLSPKKLLCRIASSSTPICLGVHSGGSSRSSSLADAPGGEALHQNVHQGRRHLQLDLVAAQQLAGAEPDDLRLALLVGHHGDAYEVEPALQGRGQIVDATVATVCRGDDGESGLRED